MTLTKFSISLSTPLQTAARVIESRDGFVVKYQHREKTGLGEATPLPGWTESVSACESALQMTLETAESDGHASALLDLEVADTPAARHGFMTALIDADACAENVPLYRWFDRNRHCDSVPVNATIGDATVKKTVDQAETAVEHGFDCLKLKAGARPVSKDIERVRAIRDAVGDTITIRVDANGEWSRTEAAEAIDALVRHDVEYVEQPLDADDLDGLANLSDGPIDVAIDESVVDHHVADVFERDVGDVLIVKPMVLGGPGNAYTIALRARDVGMKPVVTTTVDGVVARTAAVHVAAAIPNVRPCGLATACLLDTDLGPDPAFVNDGRIRVPQDPGLGIDASEVRT